MSSVNDILSSIYTGRFVAERARADHLARALSEVEAMVREMRPTADRVVIEGGNTADLADLAEMRDILDGADWPPTPLGLSEALSRADEADELDRRHAEALATISDLRAQIAALTPGPWLPMCDLPVGMAEPYQFCSVGAPDPMSPYQPPTHWRRFPAGLLKWPTDAAPTAAP